MIALVLTVAVWPSCRWRSSGGWGGEGAELAGVGLRLPPLPASHHVRGGWGNHALSLASQCGGLRPPDPGGGGVGVEGWQGFRDPHAITSGMAILPLPRCLPQSPHKKAAPAF